MACLDETAIIAITLGGLLYRDADGVVQWLDWKCCQARLQTTQAHTGRFDRRYVGARTEMYVRFFTMAPIIFIFQHPTERNLHLLQPMGKLGWFTCDEYHASSVLKI